MSRQRLLIGTLVVSLLANAFFIGFAATRMLDEPDTKRQGGILRGVSHRLTKNLDEPARLQIAGALDAVTPQYEESLQARRENYSRLRGLLAASEPDRAAIDTVLGDMTEQSSGLVLAVHEEVIEAILELPANQRAQIADEN
ncbi:periplasmic heavy metal sensor [Hoeflea poritis]|uniref:Periplasmic heavy metal sensor n=1 Tax=Hoeflea poritis TaxID=2993659 RepID=A0ABT4VHP5_9HYPH|nr:periplasmic heavy metal sensor [Hoeflea poritis]MDA4844119.1 periplasmic heavy metal sensor [Hoeflea poritis]